MSDTTAKQRRIRIGGLMRCCIGTIQEHNTEPSAKGDVLDCEHCTSQMRVAEDGVWEWVNSFRAE